MSLKVGSVFSGVEGFGLGFEAAGFDVRWQVEIDKDAVSVLKRHYPNVRRYRDVTKVNGAELERVDVLVGGSPCQDLSVAGKRAGLAGERSGLFYEIARLASEIAAPWLLLENVPGLLSSWTTDNPPPSDLEPGRTWESEETSDFGLVLSELSERGYGWAYRVLDAQYFGVPQRRERVFIVGCLGDTGARAAEVLFEPESVLWDLAACLEARQGSAGDAPGGVGISSTLRANSGRCQIESTYIAGTLSPGAHPGGLNGQDAYNGHLIAAPLTASGHPNSTAPGRHREDDENLVAFTNRGLVNEGIHETLPAASHGAIPMVADTLRSHPRPSSNGPGALAFNWQAGGGGNDTSFRGKSRQYIERAGDYAGALSATRVDAVATFDERSVTSQVNRTRVESGLPANTLHGESMSVIDGPSVRRLMPIECERLQGWPDDHTRYRADGSEIPDGPRYRMIGNGVVAPVAAWIARRLRRVMEVAS